MHCSHTICEALGMQVTGGPCPEGKNFSFLGVTHQRTVKSVWWITTSILKEKWTSTDQKTSECTAQSESKHGTVKLQVYVCAFVCMWTSTWNVKCLSYFGCGGQKSLTASSWGRMNKHTNNTNLYEKCFHRLILVRAAPWLCHSPLFHHSLT